MSETEFADNSPFEIPAVPPKASAVLKPET